MQLTDALRREYEQLYTTCQIRSERVDDADAIIDRILRNKTRYMGVEDDTGVPWFVIAILQSLEASGDLKKHLHNGDPLTARTVNVPSGRPTSGTPPFSWEESALDALEYDGLTGWNDWSVAGTCYRFEKFNGFGYRPRNINSPYLWSFSNHYERGKFVRDGVFDPNAISQQCGAMVLIKRMEERRIIDLGGFARQATWFELYREEEDGIAYPAVVAWAGDEVVEIVKITSRRNDKLVALFGRHPAAKTFLIAPDNKPLPSPD